MNIKNLKQGFTLIELMIVITVIAILAAMVLFGLGAAQKRARDVQRTQIMKAIQNALQSYYGDKSAYPTATGWSNAAATDLFNAANLGPYTSAYYDPGCGTSPNSYDVRTGVAVTGCAGAVSYAYVVSPTAGQLTTSGCPAGSPYYLALTKEAGGVSYFCGPQ